MSIGATAGAGSAAASLQGLLEALPLGVGVVDRALRVVAWNRRLAQVLGLPEGFVLDRVRLEDLLGFEHAGGQASHDAAVGQDSPPRELLEHARAFVPHRVEWSLADGRTVLVQGMPLLVGAAVPELVLTFADITEQRVSKNLLTRQRDVMQTMIDNFPGAISLCDGDLRITAYNDQFMTLLDFPPTLFARGWAHLEDLARFNAQRGEYGPGDVQHQVDTIVTRARDFRAHCMERQRPNGAWLEVRGMPIRSGGFVTSYLDITERKQAELYERFRGEILEMLANGDALPSILGAIVHGVEKLRPLMFCAIRVLDGEGTHLTAAVAPSLPPFYNVALARLEIGTDAGSCALAAARGERVVAADLAEHPTWHLHRELAARAGLRACWSEPIRASGTRVLGTFAIYHRDPRAPQPQDLEFMEQTARLAGIAIERDAAVASLRDGVAHYRLLTEDVSDVIWRMDRDHRFVYVSPADERLRGFRADEVIGRHMFEVFTDDSVVAITEQIRQSRAREARGLRVRLLNFEAQHRCKDDRVLWVEVFATPERDASGAITGFHGINRDITRRKQLEEQVHRLAYYDPLTALPNRRLLTERLAQTLAAAAGAAGRGALMVLDLDNFKSLNDRHGHGFGDALLVEVSARLRACVRESDTVARLGGDEFVVLLDGLSRQDDRAAAQAATIAETIRAALNEPYTLALDGGGDGAVSTVEHRGSASIGVTLYGGVPAAQQNLLRWADAAMYQAKAAGRNAVRFHAVQAG